MKTFDAVQGHVGKPREIKPSLREFEALLAHEEKVKADDSAAIKPIKIYANKSPNPHSIAQVDQQRGTR